MPGAKLLVSAVALFAALATSAPAATTVELERGGPKVVGDEGPNRIAVSAVEGGTAFAIEDPDGVTTRGCRQEGPTRAICPRIERPTVCEGDYCISEVSSVSVAALGGADDVRVGYGPAAEGWPRSSAFVTAGPGNDFVGGSPDVDYELDGGIGDDVIDGAGFNDKLIGGGGRDRLYGGPGYDQLVDGDRLRAPDGDLLDGGPCSEPACAPPGPPESGDADDTVDYGARRARVRVDLRTTRAVQGQRGEGDLVRGVEVAVGGAAGDLLTAGGPGAGRLLGGGGSDRLVSRNGRPGDFVNCGESIDLVAFDRGDSLVDCESLCARLAGCPRPRIEVRGLPRCIMSPFTLRVTVRGVVGFERLAVRLDDRPLLASRRRTTRVRIARPGTSRYLELVAIGRNQLRVSRTVEIISCGLAER